MNDMQDRLVATINRTADRMRQAGLPAGLVQRMERLAGQVKQPCVVAVVGRVKVGKSTFVNALLGEELAKVGTTETTATINYFAFGTPDPERPVECHWRNGKVTNVSKDFLDGLQGYDLETLRRADGIDHLKYFVPNPLLERITLVDTPGTGAVVEEHQDRTAEYMQLYNQLRGRHDAETRTLGDKADAVVYLVKQTATAEAREFLEEFSQTGEGRSSALRALGVMSKIELNEDVMARRHELAAKIASQLKGSVNTVIPVAAGVRRELDRLLEDNRAGLQRLVFTLRRVPFEALDFLLDAYEFFTEDETYEDEPIPVSVVERQELVGDMEWGVFTTIARVAADPKLDLDGVVKRLEEVSNFEKLRKTLDEHFIERGHILRCYRIVSDALDVVNEIRFTHLPRRKKEMSRERERLKLFVSIIRQADTDLATKSDFEEFVCRHLDVNARVNELEELHADLSEEFGELYHRLMQDNADFEALRRLEESDHKFSEAELEELRPLLGLYGSEIEKRLPPGKADANHVIERMLDWKGKMDQAPFGSARQVVAEQAFTRYGMIYEELIT